MNVFHRFAARATVSAMIMSMLAPQCHALSIGFYEPPEDSDQLATITHIRNTADDELYYFEADRLLLHSCPRKDNHVNWMNMEGVADTLRGRTRKEILVVWFKNCGPTVAKYSPSAIARIKKTIADIDPFIQELGYKRVLMITGSTNSTCRGFYVLADRVLR
jgi:hypothetical protein